MRGSRLRPRFAAAVAAALGPLLAGSLAITATPIAVPALAAGQGGYVVDGYGGVHPFGGAPSVALTAYWPGWKIVHGIATQPSRTSGYVLDGWGALHPFGGAPQVAVSAYWPNWDIARALTLDPCDSSGTSGYVLDGFGGVHPFGGAPGVMTSANWGGWDVAYGLAATCAAGYEEGVVLDRYGGLHPFVVNGQPMRATPSSAYWPGWNIARGVELVGLSGSVPYPGTQQFVGFTLDGLGGVHGFGGAPDPETTAQWNFDIARGLTTLPGTAGGYVLDGYGALHPFGGGLAVTTTAYWPGKDIATGLS